MIQTALVAVTMLIAIMGQSARKREKIPQATGGSLVTVVKSVDAKMPGVDDNPQNLVRRRQGFSTRFPLLEKTLSPHKNTSRTLV